MASPFMTGPLVPVGMLNLIRVVLGIHHHRFNLSVKRSKIAAMTSATSLASIGEVRPVPNGSRIVESLAIDSSAHSEKNGCWRKTVGRTLTTGNPDQLSTCSQSHCCRCWGESVISVRLICETVI